MIVMDSEFHEKKHKADEIHRERDSQSNLRSHWLFHSLKMMTLVSSAAYWKSFGRGAPELKLTNEPAEDSRIGCSRLRVCLSRHGRMGESDI